MEKGETASPFLGEKGRLHGLGSWRGRRKPQKMVKLLETLEASLKKIA
jgi:hypothetical protein